MLFRSSGDYDAVAGLGLSSLGTPVGQTTQQPVTQATATPTGTPTTPTQPPVGQTTATPTGTPTTPTGTTTTPTPVNKVAQTPKNEITNQNREAIDRAHNQTPTDPSELVKKATTTSALQQTIQAVSKSAGEEGQGSILRSEEHTSELQSH